MHLAVVAAAQRDDELVAHLAPEREPKMMGICGRAPINQTRLLGHEFAMGLASNSTRLGVRLNKVAAAHSWEPATCPIRRVAAKAAHRKSAKANEKKR